MELADTTVLLTLSAVTLPSVHGMIFYLSTTDNLFKLVDQKRRHLVRIACQFRSRWLRVKPRTHRIVHMDALQRIRVLLVASLTALPHHRVAILTGFEDAEFLWRIDLALRHELGTRLHGPAMHKRIGWRTHAAALLYAAEYFNGPRRSGGCLQCGSEPSSGPPQRCLGRRSPV